MTSKNNNSPREKASSIQKAVGILIIATSVTVGMYLMDRFPGVQMRWRKGEGPPPTSLVNNEDLQLVFIKDWNFPTGTIFDNSEIGGLSALAYDEENRRILSLSDDRGVRGPARFFAWDISFTGQIELKPRSVHPLKTSQKKEFPARNIDPEGMVWLKKDLVLITSEGEQEVTPYQPPRMLLTNQVGEYITDVPFSQVFWNGENMGSYGVRNNLAFEGVTADPSKRWVYLSTESALYQDGPVSTFEHGSPVRFVEYDRDGDSFSEVAHLVYKMDPIPDGGHKSPVAVGMNGISDILALGQRVLLVLERSYLPHLNRNVVRLFLANCLHATDVKDVEALEAKSYDTCKKKLVFDFDSIVGRLTGGSTRIDNLEGMTLWQEPSTKKHYMLFVSDNNFNDKQSTQFLLFELQGWNFEAL